MTSELTINEPILQAKDLSVVYGTRKVLDVPRLSITQNKVTALIGPNGSGKTTLSLCLSLLLKPTNGKIFYRGHIIPYGNSIMKMRRRFAVVFQEPLLLNASVWENVTLGLKLREFSRQEMNDRAQHWLERFGIISLAKRNAKTLSGGEAQRTSLARAFVLQPEIIFLDEPFAALDVPTRQSLFGDMINILQETRSTTILITHDRNEAQTLAHHIIMLLDGKIVQSGTPKELFSAPANEEIAKFVGMENIINGVVIKNHNCIVDVSVVDQIVQGVSYCQPGGSVNIFIRPEDITLSLDKSSSSARNVFSGKIVSMIPADPLMRVNLDCGFLLLALITKMSAEELNLRVGQIVYASFKATAIHIMSQN
jgi:tungstate transport system ATP-binding protein